MPYRIGVIGFESPNSIAPIIQRALSGEKLERYPKANPIKFRGQAIEAIRFSIKAIFEGNVSRTHKMDTMKWKRPYSLKDALLDAPPLDCLFIFQNYMFWKNNLKIPVVYRHHDVWSPITIRKMDILAMKNFEMKWLIRSYFPYEYKKIKRKIFSFPFIDPSMYDRDRIKKYRFVNIGPPTETFDSSYRDYIWNNMVAFDHRNRDQFEQEQLGPSFDDHDVSRQEYINILEQSDFLLCSVNWGTYMTRRDIECLASGCIPVKFIENQRGLRIANRNNFKDGKNCFFFTTKNDLRRVTKRISSMGDNEIDDMKASGYDLLMKYHTPDVRVKQLLDEVDRL